MIELNEAQRKYLKQMELIKESIKSTLKTELVWVTDDNLKKRLIAVAAQRIQNIKDDEEHMLHNLGLPN